MSHVGIWGFNYLILIENLIVYNLYRYVGITINAITGVYIFETTLLGLTVINIIIENSTVSYLKRIMLFKICLEYIQAFVLLLHGNITISVIYVLNRFTIFEIIL